MLTPIAYAVFATLAAILLIGCIIIIRNAIKIEITWKRVKKKIKAENKKQLGNINSEIQKKIHTLVPPITHEHSLN